jgi:hypothetical protein
MESPKVYDIETAHLKGFLAELHQKLGSVVIDFISDVKGDYCNLTFVGKDDILNKAKSIVASMQPLDNIDESYKTMETIYRHKNQSKYPEELLLLSMISLKGSTLENLEELLRIMEKKNYKPNYTKDVKAEIDYLNKQGKN